MSYSGSLCCFRRLVPNNAPKFEVHGSIDAVTEANQNLSFTYRLEFNLQDTPSYTDSGLAINIHLCYTLALSFDIRMWDSYLALIDILFIQYKSKRLDS